MVKRNLNLAKLHSGYLFPEIQRRKSAYLANNPNAQIISLGIGDTTEPIPTFIAETMAEKAKSLSTSAGYSGYSPEQGSHELRHLLATVFYHKLCHGDEIFISDGSKCDIGRFQLMFGSQCKVAVQDPTYPAYVDTSVAVGQTGSYDITHNHYDEIVYMPCKPENNFFPELRKTPRTDLIYFCSPNNPTGAAATYEQLEELIQFAKMNKSILIYDAAYSCYIRDDKHPTSIYEIPGARDVAIEMGSFSKMAGFTGVRLGWTVVPDTLLFDDGTQVRKDWHRIHTTFFNGASNIAQAGGLAALQPEGLDEIAKQTTFYLENAAIIKTALSDIGYEVFGGVNAPYIWVRFPGRKSWDVFEELLESVQIITTPGAGFGPCGEGFLRFSAFGHRASILDAVLRLENHLASK